MKMLLMSASAVAALILLVGAPAAYAANTLYVDASTGVDSGICGDQSSPCLTIGQAVANASDGDTIQVAAGTYGETLGPGEAVSIDKSVTLEGAQAGNPGSAARASGSPATESVITGGNFDIEASNVTVDGFSFGYAGNQICIACDALQSLSDVTIVDNVLSGYQPDNFGPWQADNAIGVNHVTNTEITGNYLTSPTADLGDFGGAAVQFFDGGCSGTVISNNTFDGADQSALSDIYFWCDSESSEGTTTITVSGNQDVNPGSTDFALFTHVGGGAEIDVVSNRVHMTSASSTAIYFSTDGNAGGVGAINIIGNTVNGSPFRAVKLTSNANIPGAVTVNGNDFSGNGVGFYADAGSLHSGATVTLRNNDLSNEGTEYPGADPQDGRGVYNNSSSGGSIDAIDNWWGCAAGPGNAGCSTVSGTVSYNPWLTGATPTNTAVPTISGTAAPGQLLTGNRGTWTGSPTSYAYQWERCDSTGNTCTAITSGGNGLSYIAHAADQGHTLVLEVIATNGNGSSSAAASAPTAVVLGPVPSNSSVPTVSGTAAVGQSLTGTRGTWTNSPTSYASQWERCDSGGSNCSAIPGGGGLTYAVHTADVGHTLELWVIASNGSGSSAPAASAPTAAVPGAVPTNSSVPTISGTAAVGSVLTAARGSWTGAPTSYAYQWERCDSNGDNCTAVAAGGSGLKYTVHVVDQGQTLEFQVTATNAYGSSVPAASAPTAVPGSAPTNNPSSPPTITGTATVGSQLTGNRGTWTNATSYGYQWLRCDSSGNNCHAITAGGNGLKYTLHTADVGHTLELQVTATNTYGNTPATSQPTAVVQP